MILWANDYTAYVSKDAAVWEVTQEKKKCPGWDISETKLLYFCNISGISLPYSWHMPASFDNKKISANFLLVLHF